MRTRPWSSNLGDLAEVVHAVEEAEAGGVRRGHLGQLGLNPLPDRHGVDANAFAGQAGHEDLPAMGLLDERAESVRDLESPLVIDFCRGVPPEDGLLLHFGPLWSTEMVGSRQTIVNAKDGGILSYVFPSPCNLLPVGVLHNRWDYRGAGKRPKGAC